MEKRLKQFINKLMQTYRQFKKIHKGAVDNYNDLMFHQAMAGGAIIIVELIMVINLTANLFIK